MTCTIAFADAEMELHPEGLVWFPAYRLLCASDMHFEKGSFFQRRATFLPPYDTEATLARLAKAMDYFKPQTFISLGDGFHDMHALERMSTKNRAVLNKLIASVEQWIWVEGNHDPVISGELRGERQQEYLKHGILFRHISQPSSTEWELSGHYHPKARICIKGHTIRAPCFVKSGKRLIMPAFGSYTGGLNVDDPALITAAPLQGRELYLMHQRRVLAWRA